MRRAPPWMIIACLGALSLAGCAGGGVAVGTCEVVKLADLPMTFDLNRPVVEAKINGRTVSMLFDTGASHTVLTEKLTRELDMAEDPNMVMLIAGVGSLSAHHNVIASRFELGGAVRSDVSLAVLNMPDDARRSFSGLLGTDILGDFDVEIDEPHRRIGLYRPRNCPDGASGLPGTPQLLAAPPGGRAIPATSVSVMVDDHPFLALLDSGTSGVAIDRKAVLSLGVSETDLARGPKAQAEVAGTKKAEVTAHRFRTLRIGSTQLPNPVMAVTDMPDTSSNLRIDLLIGGAYLRHHRVWISYAGHTVHGLD